jgi:hypothetical protein
MFAMRSSISKFKRISSALCGSSFTYSLNEASPEFCIHLISKCHNLRAFTKLHQKIIHQLNDDNDNEKWIREFIDKNGLFVLLSLIDEITEKSLLNIHSCFSSFILISKCIRCIKELLNSKYAIDYFIDIVNGNLDYNLQYVQIITKGKG